MKDKEYSGNVFDYKILKRVFQFVKPYIIWFYILILLTIVLGVVSPLLPFLIQKTIDTDIGSKNLSGLNRMLIILVCFLVIRAILQYMHTYLSGWIGQTVIRDIRVKLYSHIVSLRLRFFDQTPIGRLVTRTISDIETLSDVFTNGLAAIIGDVLQLVFILIIMFMTDWRIALISLSTFPVLVVGTYIFKEKIKSAFNDVRDAVSKLNSFVQEHITGMSIVQIFNSEKEEMKKFQQINKEHAKAHLRSVMYYSIYFPVAEIIGAISIGLVVWFGVGEAISGTAREGLFMSFTQTYLGDKITIGVIIAFIMYINMFFRPIRMIADRFNTLQMGVVSSKRILDLLDSEENIEDNGTLESDSVSGSVQFDDVSFAYDGENLVLKNISFSVEKGQTLAFIGATGAGKSSIINLLTRLYEINEGSIKVEGVDIKEYSKTFLRRNIGVVLQDVFLFSDTVAENIRLGDKRISDKQIWDAAKLVGADGFIEKLPGKLEHNVLERGASLSVGQRQLISFVRAIIYNPQILVLDEATSSIDTETEELIQNAIEQMMKGRTSIVIAHRLSTIQRANSIVVMDKGKIVEEGAHEMLLKKGGFYTKLHEMQHLELA